MFFWVGRNAFSTLGNIVTSVLRVVLLQALLTMEVKVKLLSGDTLSVVIPPESSVLDLKQRLKVGQPGGGCFFGCDLWCPICLVHGLMSQERTDVPEDRQRLVSSMTRRHVSLDADGHPRIPVLTGLLWFPLCPDRSIEGGFSRMLIP